MVRSRTDGSNPLADLVLERVDGDPVRLGELWETRPVVLVFLRRFG